MLITTIWRSFLKSVPLMLHSEENWSFLWWKNAKVHRRQGCIFQIYTLYGKHFSVLRKSVCNGVLVPLYGTRIGQCPMSSTATSRSQTRLTWSVHSLLPDVRIHVKSRKSDPSTCCLGTRDGQMCYIACWSARWWDALSDSHCSYVAGTHRWGVVHFRVARRLVGELSHEKLPGWSCQ